MTSVSNPPVVHYCFIPDSEGITLELWEPASSYGSPSSYQFRLRYQFESISNALEALHDYLQANDVDRAIAHAIDELKPYPSETLICSTLG